MEVVENNLKSFMIVWTIIVKKRECLIMRKLGNSLTSILATKIITGIQQELRVKKEYRRKSMVRMLLL